MSTIPPVVTGTIAVQWYTALQTPKFFEDYLGAGQRDPQRATEFQPMNSHCDSQPHNGSL